MSESDITRILVALAEIRGDVKAIRDENDTGKKQHEDFEDRLRSLERVRWIVVGAAGVVGSGLGAALSQLLG